MIKLELKDIIGYLPYDLKCKYNLDFSGEKTIWTLDPLAIEADYKNLKLPLWNFDCVDEIFLRPLSDLTKSIKVNGYNEGKEFIPLVELAKKSDDIVSEYSLEIIKSVPNCIEIGDGYILQYLGHSFMCFDKDDAQYSPINNVHLFDLLNQWHFDYRNLIEAGLAVDINTINL